MVSGTVDIGSTAEEALPGNTRQALSGNPEAGETSVWQSVTGLAEALLDQAGGLVRIVALEGRLAGLSLAYMLLLAVLSAVLVVSAWLLFNAAVAIWMAGNGWSILNVVLSLGIVNLVAAGGSLLVLRKFSNNLLFSGSRHELFTRQHNEAANEQA